MEKKCHLHVYVGLSASLDFLLVLLLHKMPVAVTFAQLSLLFAYAVEK